jgi:Fic-DOC domain mobile mystery protein B
MAFDPPFPTPPIRGQTPIDDLSGLLDRGIRTQRDLNAAEAENIRRAVIKYLAAKPTRRAARFDLAWCRRLHAEMFGAVWSWAGVFRTAELNIGSPPHRIETEMQSLLDDLGAWKAYGMALSEQGVRLHHGAVRIHPFLNGNGRWSRTLANIWLRLHDGPLILWPEPQIGVESEIRGAYLDAVRRADAGDYQPLLGLHDRYQEPARFR